MKALIKEAIISGILGLGLGFVILFLATNGWVNLPLPPEKRFLFIGGAGVFSSLFRLLMPIRAEGKESADPT
jgi:hypothetical protein